MVISIPSKWRDVSDVRQVPDHQEVYQDCTFASTRGQEQEQEQKQEQKQEQEEEVEGTGGCLIIEILERQDDITDEEAPSFFFHDMADANSNQKDEHEDYRENSNIRTSNAANAATATSSSPKSPSIEYSNIWTVGIEGKGKSDKGGGENQEHSNEENENKNDNLMPNLSTRVKACSCVGIQTVGPMRNQAEIEQGKSSVIKVEMCVVRLEVVQTDLLISLSMPMPMSMPMFSALDRKKKKRSQGHSNLFKSILKSFEVVDWSLFA